MPFVVSEIDERVILTSHFAKKNEQWKDIENNQVLVIFSEPHAYISPKNYDKELNVPTWNYISVHAYGNGKIITELEHIEAILEKTINNFELYYKTQWDKLPQDYKAKRINGIVAFEIYITELQAKEKLSQNKTENERKNIIGSLTNSKNANERVIAQYMSINLKNEKK